MDKQLDVNEQLKGLPGMQSAHSMVKRQEPQTVKGSGISLPHEVRQEMARKLDEHNCALHVALHQYNKHHWLNEGPESFISIHELLAEHIKMTAHHIDRIGERIARLGGIPTAHPVTQHELSYIKHEAEGRYSMRDMLRNDLEHEMAIQKKIGEQAKRAHDLQDFGTLEVLEQIITDRGDFAYHLYSLLEHDTLVRGLGHVLKGHRTTGDRKATEKAPLH